MARLGPYLRPLAGIAVAAGLLAIVELGARGAEWVRDVDTSSGFDYQLVRSRLTPDPDTGMPEPSFFVQRGDHLFIRPRYTMGERCYPFHCQSIPVDKPPEEYRIACFGGSTTFGWEVLGLDEARGLDLTAGDTDRPGDKPFCDLVAEGLAEGLPGRRVTAYNLGGDTFDSEKILPVVREVAARAPFDLWVVYMGHNELVYQPGLLERIPTPIVGLAAWVRARSAAYRGLERALFRLRFEGRVRIAGGSVFVLAEDYRQRYEAALAGYEQRLREIVALAAGAGTRVVLSELVHDPDDAAADGDPERRTYPRELTPEQIDRVIELDREARALQAAGRWEEAMAAFTRLDSVDPGSSLAAHGRGVCLLAQGRRQEALAELYRAREASRLPNVVTPRMTEIVRRVSRETGTPLAATIELFDGLFVDDPQLHSTLFVDDCHPGPAGHRLIAERIVAAVEQATAPTPGEETLP